MGPTLALTLCQHLTARVVCGWRNIGTLVATCKTRANTRLAQMLQHMQDPCQHWAQPELAHLLLRKDRANCLQMLTPGEGVDLC